jgi:hypothetical protein
MVNKFHTLVRHVSLPSTAHIHFPGTMHIGSKVRTGKGRDCPVTCHGWHSGGRWSTEWVTLTQQTSQQELKIDDYEATA